jgi:hypothetical protein
MCTRNVTFAYALTIFYGHDQALIPENNFLIALKMDYINHKF